MSIEDSTLALHSIEADKSRSNIRWLVTYVSAAIFVVPVSVLLHELGHFLSARALGFEPVAIYYAGSLTGFPPDGTPDWLQIVPSAAGQIVSFTLVLVAVASVRLAKPTATALAVVVAEAARSLVVLGHFVVTGPRDRDMFVAFDELGRIAEAFGDPPFAGFAISVLGVLVPLLAVYYLVQQLPTRRKRQALSATTIGIAVGYALYLGIVGPLLLPLDLP